MFKKLEDNPELLNKLCNFLKTIRKGVIYYDIYDWRVLCNTINYHLTKDQYKDIIDIFDKTDLFILLKDGEEKEYLSRIDFNFKNVIRWIKLQIILE